MQLHEDTFKYVQTTAEQAGQMMKVRIAAQQFAQAVESHVPGGPDQTYVLRKIRECAMWANVAITRQPDGTPRT